MFKKRSQLIFILIMTIAFLCGCNKQMDELVSCAPTVEPTEVEVKTHIRKKLFIPKEKYKGDVVKDAKVAISLADIALKVFYGKNIDECKAVSVSYQPQDKIWVVTRYGKDLISYGGCYCCAIRQSDGKILNIWIEE